MSKIYIYLIALCMGAIIYFTSTDDHKTIVAIASTVVTIALPFIFDLLKNKTTRGHILSIVTGLLAGGAGFGLLYPFLGNFPLYVSFVVLGVMLTAVSYSFYLYENDGGFSLGVSSGTPTKKTESGDGIEAPVTAKILDTSIVIDGRIIDLSSTGFIEGPLIVPNFVLREIQLISDSADPIKRNRGRRGLEMLNALQKRDDLEVRISYIDYSDTREVDAKLVKLAKDMDGKLVTNDFNLNKVAEFQNVEVLNINNLANALKPVVLPGEEMEVQVVKEGKDENQGIGYLDDGTMVVIENARKLLGKKLKVGVTSVIQTNAGKMIFTKVEPKS